MSQLLIQKDAKLKGLIVVNHKKREKGKSKLRKREKFK